MFVRLRCFFLCESFITSDVKSVDDLRGKTRQKIRIRFHHMQGGPWKYRRVIIYRLLLAESASSYKQPYCVSEYTIYD